ncbi:hypothetical protein KIL84_010767 [Mauremys mutica]|uniref:Uncharacterized protein n=1 Tax=Mauremys mutica TaxID=74926 RepID=A0A9D3XDJ9_9SAUR|nr:hypothetical protein KIL84_010767 [Mauremys mutica]
MSPALPEASGEQEDTEAGAGRGAATSSSPAPSSASSGGGARAAAPLPAAGSPSRPGPVERKSMRSAIRCAAALSPAGAREKEAGAGGVSWIPEPTDEARAASSPRGRQLRWAQV